MSEPSLAQVIAEIDDKLAKITPGEWSWEDDGNDSTYGQCRKATLYAGDRQFHGLNLLGRLEPDWNGQNNLDFIAAAPRLLAAARLALVQAQEAQGWRPIETAPRDAHAIIGLAWNRQVQPIWWSKTYNEWMWADGWHSGQALRMTHWMPLPNPPAALSAPAPRETAGTE